MLQNLRASELAQLLQWIDEIVEVDAVFDRRSSQRLLQCLFSVKPGVKTTLDLCRQTLGESTQEMERLLQGYHAALSLTELRLNYNGRRGYHFVLPASQRKLAEENGFIQMQAFSKKSISCTTESLSQLNLRCREMIGQILLTTEKEMAGLVEKIQQQVHVLFQVSESVALLDMMVAFGAHVKLAGGDWARPRMDGTASASLVLKQARHPILDRFGEHSLVANDVYATPASNFALITGPNMAGKSTYLRMTALVCLMAHVGSLVPASQANLPLLSRVFTRIASSDCLESCTSTFAGEMRETTYVLRNLGPPALVLVDELGRGTSNRDGASLAWAVAEQLLSAPRTFTFFATHYLHLANLKNLYPNVRTLMMAVEPTASRPRFMYHVQEGVCVQRQYCTEFLAELAGTPPRPCRPVPWHLPLRPARAGACSPRALCCTEPCTVAHGVGIPSSVTAAASRLSAEVDFDPVDAPSAEAKRRAACAEAAERLVRVATSSTMDGAALCHFLKQLQGRLRLTMATPPPPPPPPPNPAGAGTRDSASPPCERPSPRTTPRFTTSDAPAAAHPPRSPSPRFSAAAEALAALAAT